ncbi:MlaD family protein [Mycobacterium shinjukuense]|uniref:Putative Mce family protein n=1 Tax=Mycobacterium shinjukuense TaxID=398694 RepID=A0A7I7MUK0_9MYCO|nr:MlaD family protein [Mycobacterium shinjukuense]ORB69977.1 mammalian cell entry protein [Mycobacterium shinjukuense]BBX75958.1 putative Mce family protein [Mycobacterium shinjukuense]
MTRRSKLGALPGALIVSLTVACLGACSLDPTRLPVPGSYVPGDKYTIKVEFSSVLNLPARAKVDFGGVRVGVLDRVQLVGSTAVAYIDLANSVKLPRNTRAELRQATVLGDIYIALLPPDDPEPASLRDGDTIPLRNTVPADNVEDILRGVSNLVSGGALNTLQEAVINFNKAFPKDPAEQDRIRGKLAGILHDLAANQDTIDDILSSTEDVSRGLIANTAVLDRLITDGPGKIEAMTGVLPDIIQLLVDVQDLGRSGGELLVPNAPDFIQMLSYITPLVGSVATADTTVPVIADKLVGLIRDKLIGFFGNGGPKFIVSEVHPPRDNPGVDPADRADQAISAMRTMGMLP